MSAVRLLLFVAGILGPLVAGMLSATLLDFEPGAWVAFGAFTLLVGAACSASCHLTAGSTSATDGAGR